MLDREPVVDPAIRADELQDAPLEVPLAETAVIETPAVETPEVEALAAAAQEAEATPPIIGERREFIPNEASPQTNEM